MIPKETVEKIFDASDITEVIGDFVVLKKSGSNFKGASPFVNEKTPSFMVSPAKGIFKDLVRNLIDFRQIFEGFVKMFN